MAKRKLKDKLIEIKDIQGELKLIPNSDGYYVSSLGDIFIDYGNNLFYPKATYTTAGYKYCKIKYNGKMLSKRVHRLVAESFIMNQDKEKIVVGHKNNNKQDNRVENLYWTTTRENTKKAYEDGLAKNAKGEEDSQSNSVYQLDLEGNIIKSFGSAAQCAKATGVNISTVMRQCKHQTKGTPRCGFRFRFQEEYNLKGFVL